MWPFKRKSEPEPTIFEQETVVVYCIGYKDPIGTVRYNASRGLLYRITRCDPTRQHVQSDGAIQNAMMGVPICQIKCSSDYGWLIERIINDAENPKRAQGLLEAMPQWLKYHPDVFKEAS